MADNVELDPGTGGAIVATDDAGAGGHVQIIKLAVSADGSATVIPADAANGLDVDVTRSALPSGASTSAKQDTVIGHLDGVETVLGTIDADTSALAGTVAGAELQVDVVSSGLPSGASTSAKQDTAQTALDAIKTAVELLDNAISGSEIQADIVAALPAGNNNIGDVDVASIAAGTNTVGNVGVVPRTTGGLTIFRSLDLDETEEEVKATAGQVYGYFFANRDTTNMLYLKFYNATAANVTVGTTTPVMTLPLPAGAAGHVPFPQGIAFGTAITVAATTGVADNDTGAPDANDVVVNIFYS